MERGSISLTIIEVIMQKEFMAEAGYKYGGYCAEFGAHCLIRVDSGKRELWVANKNHASYGITWRNTHLKFVTSLPG